MARVIFMGTPEFAVPVLVALAETHQVVGVVTQPDRPAGRGRRLTASPVKQVALEHGLPLFQPQSLRLPAAVAQLAAWRPEVIIVAAFGQILRQDVLDLPPHGCLNVHGSLLPRWRGAAPVAAAILAGDEITGVTIMQMDVGLDTGPILAQREEPIRPDDTRATLGERLARLGAALLVETLPAYLAGDLLPRPQPEEGVTYARQLRKEDGLKLYVRKVLIQEYTTDLLPRHFRFVQGVVDTEDLPLNVSRETIQDNPLIAKLRKVLTRQVVNKLDEMAKKQPETYEKFWESFSGYLKEGIASEPMVSDDLAPLVRFHTTAHPESWVSFAEYIERIKSGQDKIYYILGDDPHSVARSPHLDYFRENNYEVILFTDPMDSFMLMGLRKYGDFNLVNVASPDLELPTDVSTPEDDSRLEPLSDDDFSALAERFKTQLGDRVTDVRTTDRLSDSVARLIDPDGALDQEVQRVYRYLGKDYEIPKKVLELNPRHPIIRRLSALPSDDELGNEVIEQIYDSALLIEGLHPDPASMLSRIQDLMERALN